MSMMIPKMKRSKNSRRKIDEFIQIIPFEENSKFEDHLDVIELPEIFQEIAWV